MCGLYCGRWRMCGLYCGRQHMCCLYAARRRRRRRPDHENRPDRYGFNFRSRPRVVDGPCPGYTCMESG